MPLAEEYRVRKDHSIPQENLATIIQQPTGEWAHNFSTLFHEMNGHKRAPAMRGKFVVVRSVVLMAPFPHEVSHHQIRTELAEADPVLQALIDAQLELAAEQGQRLLPNSDWSTPVTDAGSFFMPSEGMMMLTGHSDTYSRGDDATRKQTVTKIQSQIRQTGGDMYVSPWGI